MKTTKIIQLKNNQIFEVSCCELCPCSYLDKTYGKNGDEIWRCSLIDMEAEEADKDSNFSVIFDVVFHKKCPLPEVIK